MGASGSPEKQLTPAPQPRSAWVSARSVVVTAAHRAWGRGAGEIRVGRVSPSWSEGPVGKGMWREEGGSGGRHPGLGAHPQIERKRGEEEEKGQGGEGGWAGVTQGRPEVPAAQVSPLLAAPRILPSLFSRGSEAPSAL